MTAFNRRYYSSFSSLWQDIRDLLQQRKGIKKIMRDTPISESFRERLMLAVTAVNGCRYCQFAHARLALRAGIPKDELGQLLNGDLVNSPSEEIPTLLYAQHWAETDGSPDRHVRQSLQETYGAEQLESIELTLRMIRIGNLLGNTWDYFLHKISSGHWGH